MFDDDDNKDDGSVWTSYSDLFTTVAVIFLVMFVFALIKAGVSKMETVVTKRKHESELKGKITKEVKKKTQKNITKVDKSLKDIEQYENLIDDKMKQMNSFVKNLQNNKKVMKEIIKDQTRKEAQLVVVAKQLSKVEVNYKKSETINKKLNTDLAAKIKKVSELDVLQKKLQKQLEDLKNHKKITLEVVQAKELKNKKLSKKLEKAQDVIKHELTLKEQKDKSIEKLDEKLRVSKLDLQQTFQNLKTERQEKKEYKLELEDSVRKASNKFAHQELEIEKLHKEIKISRDTVTKVKTHNSKQVSEIKNKNRNIQELSKENLEQVQLVKQLQTKIVTEQKIKQTVISKNEKLQNENSTNQKQNIALVKEAKQRSVKVSNLSKSIQQFETKTTQMRSLIAKLQNNNNSKNNELFKSEQGMAKLVKSLDSEKKLRVKLDIEKQSLGHSNKTLVQNNSDLTKKLSNLNKGLKGSKGTVRNLAKTNESLKGQVDKLQKSNGALSSNNKKLSKEIDGQGVKLGAMGALEEKMNKLKMDNFNQKGKYEAKLGAAGQSIEKLTKKLKSKTQQEVLASSKAKLCKKNKSTAQSRIAFLEDKQKVFGSQTKDEQNKNKKLLTNLGLNNKKLQSSNRNLKDSLNNFAEKVAGVKGKLRTNIANDLASEFKKANIDVFVDNKTGNVVLLMNKNFRFKKNSFLLNKAAKNTLKTIVPIYSKVLFGNKKIRDKIQGFNVVGHASPSFKGTYVEPLADNNAAYAYNMRLSAQRAASITNFIFGKRIGNYTFKRKLKGYTKAIGQGFTKPIHSSKIKINRSLASNGSNCGPYNCHASQRVELSFTLKDDVKSLNNLINMAKEVQE
jgi:chromosome segregation ATPase